MKGTIAGQITQIGVVQEFGDNGFKKRELIIKTVEEYPKFYKIDFNKEKVDLLNGFEVGQVVQVKCGLVGREYQNDNGQYNVFMSLNAWEISLN